MRGLADKLKGYIIGMAMGDALGAVQEQLSKEKREEIFGYIEDFLVLEPSDKFYREPYSYTDDTQMALVTIDTFLEKKTIEPAHIATKLLEKKDNLIGPGTGTKNALANLGEYDDFTKSGQERPGNSPAFRCSPVGIIYHKDSKKITEACERITKITHTHPTSLAAAVLTAHCINYLFTEKDPADLLNYLYLKIQDIDKEFADKIKKLDSYNSVDEIGTSSYALESVPAALYIFIKNIKDIKKGMLIAINSGGDTDSMGGLVGAFYGALYGYKALPKKWKSKVKNSKLLQQKMEELKEKI